MKPVKNLYGIIGHPLGHSLSPGIHNAGFEHFDLPSVYLAWPTPPERLAAMIEAVRTLPVSGLSVTIPHKETIIPLLDCITATAKRVGAVNTLFWQEGRLWGDNTDVAGFLNPLRKSGEEMKSALILGAGGAARAVAAGLKDIGVAEILVSNRSAERARELAREFDLTSVPWEERGRTGSELLVNTTPLGMQGDNLNLSPWPEDAGFVEVRLAYDLIYNPSETIFLKLARKAGVKTFSGVEMFIGQAREQFRIWTSLVLPDELARNILNSGLNSKK